MTTLLNQGFLMLLAVSLGAGLLGLAAIALTPYLRGFGARARYMLWMLLFLALLVPLRPSLGGSLVHITLPANDANVTETAPAAVTTAQVGVVQPSATAAASSSVALQDVAPVTDRAGLLPPDVQAWLDSNVQGALRQTMQWLGVLWLAGALILVGYQLWRHLRFVRTVRRWSEPASDPQLNSLYQALVQEMGIKRAPKLAVCAGVRSPLLYGYFAPTILLPSRTIPLDEATLILRHELIHYQRGDLWWRALVLLATALHWFNPAVYLMAYAAAAECEISCDERLLRGMDARERRRYGEAILGVVRAGGIPHSALTTTFYGGKQGMKTRIEAIMDTSTKRTGIAVLLMMVLAILSTGALFAADPAQEPPVAPASPVSSTLPTLPEGATAIIIRSENGVTEMSIDGGATWQSVPEGAGFNFVPALPLVDARGNAMAPTVEWSAATQLLTGTATVSGTTMVRPAQLALPASGVRVITGTECEASALADDAEAENADAPPILCITSIVTSTAAFTDGAPGFYLAQPVAGGALSTHAVEIRGAAAVPALEYAPGDPVPSYGVYAVPSVPPLAVQGGSVMAIPAQSIEVMRPGAAGSVTVLAVPAAVSGSVAVTAAPGAPVPVVGGEMITVMPSAIARDAEGSVSVYGSSASDVAPGAPVIITLRDGESAPAVGSVIEAVPGTPAVTIERGTVDAIPAASVDLLAPEAVLNFDVAIADYEAVGIFADANGALTFGNRPVRLLVDNGPQGQFSMTFEGTEDGVALQVQRNSAGELVGVRIIK